MPVHIALLWPRPYRDYINRLPLIVFLVAWRLQCSCFVYREHWPSSADHQKCVVLAQNHPWQRLGQRVGCHCATVDPIPTLALGWAAIMLGTISAANRAEMPQLRVVSAVTVTTAPLRAIARRCAYWFHPVADRDRRGCPPNYPDRGCR